MNRIANLLVLLLLISFILPATAIKHVSGSTDNYTSSSGESIENKAASPANMTENNANKTEVEDLPIGPYTPGGWESCWAHRE